MGVEGLAGVKSEVINRVPFKDRLVSNERKKAGSQGGRSADSVTSLPVDGAIDPEFSQAELQEFLAADYLETRADPAFKETLRRKLWTLISNRTDPGSSSSDSS